MKKYLALFLLCSFFSFSACKTYNASKTPPPGQMKKMAGTKSAKPFAPGQQKKNN